LKSIDARVVTKAGQRFPFPVRRRAKWFLARSSRERAIIAGARANAARPPARSSPATFQRAARRRAAPCPCVSPSPQSTSPLIGTVDARHSGRGERMVGVAWVIASSRSIPADAELRCDLCIVGAGDARFKVRAHLAIPGVGGLEIVRVLAHSGYGNRSGMSGGTYTCAISRPNWENCASRQRIELVNSASSERVMESIAIGDSLSGPKSGTARMSESPNSGVVNADGPVHHLENLHVAGCATVSTSRQANPILIVMIMAMRLAQHLETRLDNGFI